MKKGKIEVITKRTIGACNNVQRSNTTSAPCSLVVEMHA
jgi:hypothetical protein